MVDMTRIKNAIQYVTGRKSADGKVSTIDVGLTGKDGTPVYFTFDEETGELLISGNINVENEIVNMRVVANTTEYTQTSLVANVLTIASSKGITLKNDGNSDFTITIGSFIFTIRTGEVREIELANPFTSVTFSANAVFRAFGITRSA